MAHKIELLIENEWDNWDRYVYQHPAGTVYHLSGWQKIIKEIYGHKSYYLVAKEKYNDVHNSTNVVDREAHIVGVLPLIQLKHRFFANSFISLPFFDLGGILAQNEKVEGDLLSAVIELCQRLGVKEIELRHSTPLQTFQRVAQEKQREAVPVFSWTERQHKVRMMLDLPGSPDALISSFKSKLRSQINRPAKEGLRAVVGGEELLDDFYKVFSLNMRDLGSPVHSKKLMEGVLAQFREKARLFVIYKGRQPLACSITIGFRDTIENPWASALRKFSKLSPNMLLYWSMLKYACEEGYARFDFGRSSRGHGTHRFKEQWGAKPLPLYWYTISLDGREEKVKEVEGGRFHNAIRIWQKMPVGLTRVIGPVIRKRIGL